MGNVIDQELIHAVNNYNDLNKEIKNLKKVAKWHKKLSNIQVIESKFLFLIPNISLRLKIASVENEKKSGFCLKAIKNLDLVLVKHENDLEDKFKPVVLEKMDRYELLNCVREWSQEINEIEKKESESLTGETEQYNQHKLMIVEIWNRLMNDRNYNLVQPYQDLVAYQSMINIFEKNIKFKI